MNNKYYTRFQLFTHNPFWETYLRWTYQKCIDDFNKIKYHPDFFKKDFTAMLCGTSGERTSSIFVDFVLSKNNQAKIIILDISEMQLTESKKLLTKLFPKADIEYIKADAKKTSLISESIDFIETDGFFEYFNSKDLLLLMKEWRRLLRKDGFATTRAFASSSFFGKMVDIIRVFICKHYLDVIIHVHHMNAIEDIINKARFKFVQGGGSFCPTFKRFSLLKKG